MDPTTAIGVASAAITFLGFTVDVCKVFSQIVSSEEGATKYNADVEAIVKRYKDMIEALQYKSSASTILQLGPDISGAVKDGIVVSEKLLILLERLRKAKDVRVIGPLKAVYLSLRYREDVDRLQRKAESCRSAIDHGLMQATWETSALNHESSQKGFQGLDSQAIALQAAVRAGGSDFLKHLNDSRQHFDATLSDFRDSLRTDNDQITHKIDSLTQKVLDMAKPDLKKAFVDSLFFPDYERREKDLSGPSPKTFEWIFDRDGGASSSKTGKARWPSFPKWLENSDSGQQYWLGGKAGSGKSTLMAHIIREDMALKRTQDHLKKWHGTKPLHILKFFLFRPGRETQAGFEALLRSLLYQVVTFIPLLQEILMARFLRPECGTRIATWPVEILKKMLSSALDAAADCCFLIFVDGVDEFEDFQHIRDRFVCANDLVDFLFDIQKPAHVKLCISSRPELRIAQTHPSFLEIKLAGLNWEDISRSVHRQMQAMTAIPKVKDRTILAVKISRRAEGIFLWASFAVAQMKKACHEGYGEEFPVLLGKLSGMGKGLNDVIARMVRGMEKSHMAALAFYLQTLKSLDLLDNAFSGTFGSMPTVALIAASRLEEGMESRSSFLAACRREQRYIQNFSQGIIEIEEPQRIAYSHPVLVRSHRNHCSENDLLNETLNFEPGEGAWVTVAHTGQFSEITKYCGTRVSLIHRSAYDFFFAPEDWDREHIEQSELLLGHHDELEVPAKVQAGLRKLVWIGPITHEDDRRITCLRSALEDRSRDLVRYALVTAYILSTLSDLKTFVDDLLSTMRLELLLALDEVPLLESREHIPGDIFSHQMHNGCLRLLDEDRLLNFELEGCPEDQTHMILLEARFLVECYVWGDPYNIVSAHLSPVDSRPFRRLVQARFLEEICRIGGASTEANQLPVFSSLQRWADALARRRKSSSLQNSVQRWFGQLILGRNSAKDEGTERTTPTRTDVSTLSGYRQKCQWMALGPDKITLRHEKFILDSLVHNLVFRVRKGPSPDCDAVGRLARIMEPWDIWITVDVGWTEERQLFGGDRMALLIHMSSFAGANTDMLERRSTNASLARYRLLCLDPAEISSPTKVIASLEMDLPLEFWYGDATLVQGYFLSDEQRGRELRQWQADTLIDGVRQSTELEQDQKNIMVNILSTYVGKGLEWAETRGPHRRVSVPFSAG